MSYDTRRERTIKQIMPADGWWSAQIFRVNMSADDDPYPNCQHPYGCDHYVRDIFPVVGWALVEWADGISDVQALIAEDTIGRFTHQGGSLATGILPTEQDDARDPTFLVAASSRSEIEMFLASTWGDIKLEIADAEKREKHRQELRQLRFKKASQR